MATRHYSNEQEKQLARLLGGTVTPNSGGTKFGVYKINFYYIIVEQHNLYNKGEFYGKIFR